MVAEFARAIVNRASQLWETIVCCTGGPSAGQSRHVASDSAYLEGATGNDSDNDSDSEDVVVMTHTIPSGGLATLHIYNDNNTIGMLGK
eukprot:4409017-Amphidinium_carterae.1